MKMIRFSPAKLDHYADEYFDSADFLLKENGDKDRVQALELAGIAIRMWAVRMREANKRAKKKAIASKA